MGNLLSGSRAPNQSSIRDTTPEYLALRKCYENVIGTVKEQPGAICDALFAKGYVPTSVRDFTRSRSILDEVKAQKLVDTIIDRIGTDPNVFHGFVDILKGPSTDDIVTLLQEAYDTERGLVGDLEPEHLASQQAKSSAECDSSGDESFHSTAAELRSFICPFCKECTLERFFSEEGCPRRTRSIKGYSKLFPYMDVKGLEEDEVIDLQQRLISDTKEILKKYADFSIYIRESLKRQNILLEEIKHSILSLRAFTEIHNEVKVLDSIEHQEKLLGASSVSEVFLILQSNNYISFYNYHLLEHLIKHHGCSDDHRLLEEYVRDLHTFFQRNVFEIPPLVFSSGCNVLEKGKLFALKCAKGVETLEGVQTLQNEVAKVFGLRFSALRLCLIKNGCVELHFMVSAAVAERIFPVSHGQHLALSEIGIKFLELSDQLILACLKGSISEVSSLLVAQGVSVNCRSQDGTFPLLAACRGGHTETAQLLIDKGADVNQLDETSPLLAACDGGHTETAQLLIDKGADVNQLDEHQTSPLLAACEGGHIETAQLLIDKGADVNLFDEGMKSPLLVACRGGQTETAQLLIDKGADVNQLDETSPLLAACDGGHTETAQLLIDKGADVNQLDWNQTSPLLAACQGGHTETALLLIDKGADVSQLDENQTSPLLAACDGGHTETAQLLIDKGADVNQLAWGQTSPLLAACDGGHTETAQLLIDKGADVNQLDWTSPLLAACQRGHTETALLLIDKGADVNQLDEGQTSPLLAACWGGHTETALLLIDKGADVNQLNKGQTSPLLVACWGGHTETALLLIDKGADLNQLNKRQTSPLLAASEGGHTETALLLINKGADVNQLDETQTSPLLATCQGGHTETALLLIDKGADVNQLNKTSPLLAACKGGHTETAQLLIDKGADVNQLDEDKRSPLLAACKGGHTETALLLIDKRANVNQHDWLGRTPLMVATVHGYSEIALLLSGNEAEESESEEWFSYKRYSTPELELFSSSSRAGSVGSHHSRGSSCGTRRSYEKYYKGYERSSSRAGSVGSHHSRGSSCGSRRSYAE